MAYSIISPPQSFVQFGETGRIDHCIFDRLNFCLPVFQDDDAAFQFVISGTISEIDALCGVYGIPVEIGIVSDCDDEDFLLDFTDMGYGYKPEMFRLSDTQMLVNWSHGFPGFTGVVALNECFNVRIQIDMQQFCSTCFERTADNCFTSVIEYRSDENSFGFNYCNSGAVDEDALTCEPTVITFTNVDTLIVPYTQMLMDKYGPAPTIQVWVSDGVNLLNMGITAAMDTYPPTTLSFDFGGTASGIIVIK